MAEGDTFGIAALVRKRAELAGRIGHAREELDAMLASLAALDATLCLHRDRAGQAPQSAARNQTET